ncbi:MAG: phenylpyruvate tautomerase MIF-related protein [Clostridia bacterium]
MPYIHLSTDRTLSPAEIQTLYALLSAHASRDLGKPAARCMLHISTGQALAMGDGAANCAFVEARLRGESDAASRAAFAGSLRQALSVALQTQPEKIYINLLEMTEGAVLGSIF